jgi:hypothetical protein
MALGIKRIVRAFLVSGTAAAGLSLTMAGTAQADVIPLPGVYYELFLPYNAAYSECLDVPSASTTPGTQVQIYHCHGYASNGANQLWQFFKVPGTEGWYGANWLYWIVNKNSGMCLGLDQGESAVRQRICAPGNIAQLWGISQSNIDLNGEGLIQLFNGEWPANCMGVMNGVRSNSTPVWTTDRCDYSSTPEQTNEDQSWGLG